MRSCLTILLLVLLAFSSPVHAGSGELPSVQAESATPEASVLADKVSLEEAVRRVRRQYGGKIVSAETRGRPGNRVHVIKVLTDNGRVHTVRVSAE